MNTSVLDSEKVLLAREILGITDINILNDVKRRLIGVFSKERKSDTDNTERVLKAVAGKWHDSRTAEEMVDDIYKSRTSKSNEDLIAILNS